MKLENCRIGTKYRLLKDCGLHKEGSVVECVGLITNLKVSVNSSADCIIVKNEGRKTHSFIPCDSIIQDLDSLLDKMTGCNWGAVGRAMKVLEGETTKDKPYTDKLAKMGKRIFYPTVGIHTKATGLKPPEVDVSQVQVFENRENLQNLSNLPNEVKDDGKCTCSIETIWREGCRCGGK